MDTETATELLKVAAWENRNKMGCRPWWRFWHRPKPVMIDGTLAVTTLETTDWNDDLVVQRCIARFRCQCGAVQKLVILQPVVT